MINPGAELLMKKRIKNKLTKCKLCGTGISQSNMEGHPNSSACKIIQERRLVTLKSDSLKEFTNCRICHTKVKTKNYKQHFKKFHKGTPGGIRGKVTVRGTKQKGQFECDKCRKCVVNPTAYIVYDKRVLYCYSCAVKHRNEFKTTKNRLDIMDSKFCVSSGGGPGTGKKR